MFKNNIVFFWESKLFTKILEILCSNFIIFKNNGFPEKNFIVIKNNNILMAQYV